VGHAGASHLTLPKARPEGVVASESRIIAMPSRGNRNAGIAGSLARMSIADLLQFIGAGQKSGDLRVSRESVTNEIFFEKRVIVGSTSTHPKVVRSILSGCPFHEAESLLMLRKLLDSKSIALPV